MHRFFEGLLRTHWYRIPADIRTINKHENQSWLRETKYILLERIKTAVFYMF